MRFQDLFQSYSGAYGRYRVTGELDDRGKAKGHARTALGTPTDEDWQAHLNGTGDGLGCVPLLDDNECVYWAAIDIDKYPFDHAALEKDTANLPVVITKSKSGGAHCWIFFKEPVKAKLVVAKLAEWAAALGHGGVEIFPKQTSRLTDKDVGNWINLPYYGETRRCIHEGKEVDLATFLEKADKSRISSAQLLRINLFKGDMRLFADGPPCLQTIFANGKAHEGERNRLIFAVGTYFKLATPTEWRENLVAFNRDHVSPPLFPKELSTTMASLGAKDYAYICESPPLQTYCNRRLCMKREFGVEEGNKELNVSLTGLTQILTSPPRWLINIDGARVELETADLLSQERFRRFAAESVRRIPKRIKADIWDKTIQDVLDKAELIEAPPEASPSGQFIEHVLHFIEQNQQDESIDMLLNGRVFIEGGIAFFRSSDLYTYLKRERFMEMKTQAMYTVLGSLGMVRGRCNVKGATVAYWRLKLDKLQATQDQAFDAPKFENPFGEEK